MSMPLSSPLASTAAVLLVRVVASCALLFIARDLRAQPVAGTGSPGGAYVGLLEGGGRLGPTDLTQAGTAFRAPGPLSVRAAGDTNAGGAFLIGVQGGYEWSRWVVGGGGGKWGARPAVEVEGYFLRSSAIGTLVNPTEVIPGHTFDVTLPMRSSVFVVSSLWVLKTPRPERVRAYAALGVGAARVSAKGADSAQINPAEPGINHFNSDPDERDSTFAVQPKAGAAITLTRRFALTTEYR